MIAVAGSKYRLKRFVSRGQAYTPFLWHVTDGKVELRTYAEVSLAKDHPNKKIVTVDEFKRDWKLHEENEAPQAR